MHWKLKAALQRALSVTPGGTRVNDLLQRVARRSSELDDEAFSFRASTAAAHLDLGLEYLGLPASAIVVYEFGAGSDLVGALTRASRGVVSQRIIDRDALLRPALVADVLAKFGRYRGQLDLAPLPTLSVASRRSLLHDLRVEVGIDYRAPCDARATGLEAKSVDLVVSNSTFEHIPESELLPVIDECRRLVRDDGVMCFRIDYEDHYAIFDRDLSSYNFLRYSDREWRRYNSYLQFQNRLRHRDYLSLFARAQLVPVSVQVLEASEPTLAELARIPIADRFRAYTLSELGTRKGTFVLKKKTT